MARNALLFHHTHTADSNRFEDEVRGLEIASHAADYVEVVRRSPPDLDAVFVKTDHWKTDPRYFDRLERRLADLGSSLDRFDAHACFEVGGSTAVVINGVEASVDSERKHVTICGLPLTDEGVYHDLSMDRLLDVGTRAGWIAPAHVGMPLHRISEAFLSELFDRAADDAASVALGYPTGYFPCYNGLSRNDAPFRTSVERYARRYEVPLLPELDLHGVLPRGLSGCGVLEAAVVDALRGGTLPVEGVLAADLLRPEGRRNGISPSQFLLNYAALVPLAGPDVDHAERFEASIPDRDWLRSLDVPANTVPLP